MIYNNDRILLQNRVKEDWRGLTFPGGHVEKEESFVEAVKREMKEETGLTVYLPQMCGIKQFQTENDERYVVLLFKTNQFFGELRSSEEGEMIWISRDDLENSLLAEGFFDTLQTYDNANLTELFYEHNKEEDTWTARLY